LYKRLKHIFILNSHSMNKKKLDITQNQILTACRSENIKKEILISKRKGDIEHFVAQILLQQKPVRIYACGGDGTLNILANCVYGRNEAEIGIIPFGTGNDFIRNFSNTKYFSDIERQIKGSAIKIDCIEFDNKIAVNMLNIGFDSMVAEKTEDIKKLPLIKGPMAYIIGVAVILKQMPFTEMEIIIDKNETLQGKFLLCAIANGSYCGGGFNALSEAVIDDGLIDMIAVNPLGRLKFLSMVGKYKKGKLLNTALADKVLTYRKCRNVKIKTSQKVNICVDGEMYPSFGTEFDIVKKAVNFAVPFGSDVVNKIIF